MNSSEVAQFLTSRGTLFLVAARVFRVTKFRDLATLVLVRFRSEFEPTCFITGVLHSFSVLSSDAVQMSSGVTAIAVIAPL